MYLYKLYTDRKIVSGWRHPPVGYVDSTNA